MEELRNSCLVDTGIVVVVAKKIGRDDVGKEERA